MVTVSIAHVCAKYFSFAKQFQIVKLEFISIADLDP